MVIAKRHYRDAVTRMLRATGLNSVPEAALLVATLKDLAEQLDNGAGGRAMTAWISAQTKLQRFLDGRALVKQPRQTAAEKKAAEKAAAEAEAASKATEKKPNDLEAYLERQGLAS